MKYIAVTVILIVLTSASLTARWGQVGHFATGEVAERYLTEKTRAEVQRVLGGASIASATTWMDEVRPTPEYSYSRDWHWVTVPPGETYEESEKNPNGDVIAALERKISQLKAGDLAEREEREKLKMVIHMIGDIHQPLHVGTGEDRGGNEVVVYWEGQETNLHRVWDTHMIVSLGMDYQEFARHVNTATEEQVREWQSASVRDWARESISYRDNVYDLPEDRQLGVEYRDRNIALVEKRVLQGGVRMAGVLNAIYDSE